METGGEANNKKLVNVSRVVKWTTINDIQKEAVINTMDGM